MAEIRSMSISGTVRKVFDLPKDLAPLSKSTYTTFQPETVTVTWRTGGWNKFPDVSVRGRRILKNGGFGAVVDHKVWSTDDHPDWLVEILTEHTPVWSEVRLD